MKKCTALLCLLALPFLVHAEPPFTGPADYQVSTPTNVQADFTYVDLTANNPTGTLRSFYLWLDDFLTNVVARDQFSYLDPTSGTAQAFFNAIDDALSDQNDSITNLWLLAGLNQSNTITNVSFQTGSAWVGSNVLGTLYLTYPSNTAANTHADTSNWSVVTGNTVQQALDSIDEALALEPNLGSHTFLYAASSTQYFTQADSPFGYALGTAINEGDYALNNSTNVSLSLPGRYLVAVTIGTWLDQIASFDTWIKATPLTGTNLYDTRTILQLNPVAEARATNLYFKQSGSAVIYVPNTNTQYFLQGSVVGSGTASVNLVDMNFIRIGDE